MSLLLVLCLGWISGIAAGAFVNQPVWAWLVLAGLGGLGLFRFRAELNLRLALTGILAVGLGGAWYQWRQPVYDESFLATYNGTEVKPAEVLIEGVVWDEPDVRDTRTNLRLRVDTALLPNATSPIPVRGMALVYAPRFSDVRRERAEDRDPEFHYGDRLRVYGSLETPPVFEDFSYADYLARQGVYSQVRFAQIEFLAEKKGQPVFQQLFDFKRKALGVLAQIFPEPHASLLQGILLGYESGIPQKLKDAFSATGASHIIAISGFNIAIIAGIFANLANRLFGKQRGAMVAIVGIILYTLLVGAGPSVVRAAIMGSLALVAERLGRRTAGLNTLAAAVIAMTAWNPLTLWDVGFQLSAAATFGLVMYAEPFENIFRSVAGRFTTPENASRLTSYVAEFFLLTLAAQISTLPLIAFYFKRISLVSFLANMIILPAQPAVMVTGGLALIAGLISVPLGKVVALIAWPFTTYTIAFVQWFARWPRASIALGEVAPAFVVGSYGLLIGGTVLLQRPPEQRPAWLKFSAPSWLGTVLVTGLALGAFITWSYYFSLPNGRLKITALNVGKGEAVLIQTPSGATTLIDGGPSGGALVRALNEQLPLFASQIDLLVIAGAGDESLGGLPDMLARYAVNRVVVTASPGRSATYRTVMQTLTDKQIPQDSASDLPAYDLGDGVTLRVLYDGQAGSVLRLEMERFSALMVIGLDDSPEAQRLLETLAPGTALIVPANGAGEVINSAWVSAINPRATFLAAGVEAAGVIQTILPNFAGRQVWRTDRDGALTVYSDGVQMWVETER
jgi:competence protein ComEC